MPDRPYRSPHRGNPPDDDTQAMILKVAREVWNCPRGDKFHFMTEADAREGLAMAVREVPGRHEGNTVYRCRCTGWVYGRAVPGIDCPNGHGHLFGRPCRTCGAKPGEEA